MFAALSNASRRLSTIAAARPGHAGWQVRDEVMMGTTIHVELWSDEARQGSAAIDAVMAEMHRIDLAMSPVRATSELSRINREAALHAVPVSAEMFDLLACAINYSRLSGGAFDITYASAGHLYDYRLGVEPTPLALQRACDAVGWQHLMLDPRRSTVQFARPGMRIDLGGFAKGHAVDNAASILAQRGIAHAIVSAGGDSRAVGDRRGRPWTVAVRDPRREGDVVAVLPLEDVSISTSGDYERYFERDGRRCHHILDPRTGRSPAGVRSVTILADNGLKTEALSKSVFVLGLVRGMQMIESLPNTDAVVVDADGTLHFSSGLLQAQTAHSPAQ